jgi:hypothetical protein
VVTCTFDKGGVLLYSDNYTDDNTNIECAGPSWGTTQHIFHDESPLHVRAGSTKAQQFAKAALAQGTAKTLDKLIPEHYRDFAKVFDKAASESLPDHGPWDHAVDLKPDFKPKPCKLYPLLPMEQAKLDTFLKKNLDKGYIRASKSPMASPFFFVKKKDGKLRPVQDYQRLNAGTIKNAYPLPLINKLIDQLKGAKVFSKVDIQWGYPNIRMKEGHEWKVAFCTNRGLFEPLVMFFGLTNSPATFQAMINERFKDLIAKGVVVVYKDDILIFTKTLKEHRQVIRRVLQILTDNDLYLKLEKCLFEQESIEFLGLIILHDYVGMDPVKVDGILVWPAPHNVKEVQSFVGFCNFYRCFIKDFSNTAQPLHYLTTKDKVWEWSDACQTAFDTLKQQFASSPILVIPDSTKPYRIECDASDYATDAILSQQSDDNLWHPVAYLSKAMTAAERNYDIHNKELLAVVHAFDTWQHYLEGTTHFIDVFSNHSNLTYFTEAQKLN